MPEKEDIPERYADGFRFQYDEPLKLFPPIETNPWCIDDYRYLHYPSYNELRNMWDDKAELRRNGSPKDGITVERVKDHTQLRYRKPGSDAPGVWISINDAYERAGWRIRQAREFQSIYDEARYSTGSSYSGDLMDPYDSLRYQVAPAATAGPDFEEKEEKK